MARALVNVPKSARRGEVIEIKTLLSHAMETGHRTGPNGTILPRDIVERFSCTYNGVVVFEADLHPAISANPYLVFTTVARESGTIALTWSGDNGFAQTETALIVVT